ncbi:AAA family ATPase [Flavobacterium alkalisoli]|uniref:AAA family ATPase n=1 Tax=Flavobacterium alkalisoli TaxID=2602769 RepID=A0A5B9FX85_9FLAO|nr:AAA family ATPase [Flavobacterium alkalisoli]QEE50939.1 AAA family ATPase [Flavobacterium alkalisoli]
MINESSLTFLEKLPHRLVLDKLECQGDEKKFKSRVSYKRFTLLKDLIKEFLGKEILWHYKNSDIDEHDDHVSIKARGYWTINNRTFNYQDFSDGEKVLFSYAILLFLLNLNPKIKFKESIIIIDEPELNLHPKAQIKLIQSLENLVKERGQLIIATHSLSIIATLDYGSIFLVKDDELLTPSSSVPFNAVDELMGFEEHYNKIVEFLVSTPSWAMTNFMAQCFKDPEVFESANKNDPQLDVFKQLILKKKELRILDFGSGLGRLLKCIKEDNETWSRIKNYDCFDINKDYNQTVLEQGANAIFNEIDNVPKNFYDIIVLVNVLHEIHIQYWEDTLNKLKLALSSNGHLVIIEDFELPIGELPNDLGFLLLEKDELKILLGKNVTFISPNNDRYKNRIIGSIISSENMNTIDKKLIIKTMESLKENALNAIQDYRNMQEKKLNIGRLYALKSNSYVNSQLAINYLNEQKSG